MREMGVTLFRALLLFLSPRRLFHYLKRRYSDVQVAILNNTLKARGKLNSVSANLNFLRQCLVNGVAPKRIQARLRRAKVFHSLKIERIFIEDEASKCEQSLDHWRRTFHQHLSSAQRFLTFCDFVRFCPLISEIDEKQRKRCLQRDERNISLLKRQRYGSLSVSYDTIINLSDIDLTNIQKDVLCRGVHFGIPGRHNREEVLAEFEVFYQNLIQFVPRSKKAAECCRSSIEAIAHEYANKESDRRSFSLRREHLQALRELRNNEDIVISKPDKGRATVIMKRTEYVDKMKFILDDTSKFVRLGPVKTHDKTLSVEAQLNKFLADLVSAGEITEQLHDSLRAVGSQRPRMYGLPKIHKEGCPLRTILSMTGSPQYVVSQWLCELLEPVLSKYSARCVKDSFGFVNLLKEKRIPSTGHMCSFDIVSLFTNVPLQETIDICMDALYRDDRVESTYTAINEDSLLKLLLMVTSGVEFSFDDTMYRQTDGVAMGSPLGPVLANIFVGSCESQIPDESWPLLFCRFVDDSFAHFDNSCQSEEFLVRLNGLHPALKFTCEHESAGRLPFMDVCVDRSMNGSLETSVFRKPTFTGLYITWDSFCATKYKVNLVKNLVNRAQRICSGSRLNEELDKLKEIFMKNGYPEDLLARIIKSKKEPDAPFYGPRRCPVYLRLPWKGHWSSIRTCSLASVVRSTYCAVDVNVVYSTTRAFTIKKDVLPALQKSNVIYGFECRECETRYVGRTLQCLSSRIRQHVPLNLLPAGSNARSLRPKRVRPRKSNTGADTEEVCRRPLRRCPPRQCKTSSSPVMAEATSSRLAPHVQRAYQSAIARHLAEHELCLSAYDDNAFTVLCRARSKRHLEILEAVFISTHAPQLCAQKQQVSPLKLFTKLTPTGSE